MPAEPAARPAAALLGDIGGTNASFVLLPEQGPPAAPTVLPVAAYAGPEAAIDAALTGRPPPPLAVLAVAGPVHRTPVTLTNAAWRFEPDAIAAATGIARVELLNDFAAQAWGVPAFAPADLLALGGGAPVAGAPRAILGAGTGLGTAALLPDAAGREARVLSGEGGHATLAAEDAAETALLARLRDSYGRVSAERVLSGPGLAALAAAVAAERGAPAPPGDPAAVIAAGRAGDPVCAAALARFVGFLGSYAGDLALILGAWGGVYLSGGVPPRLREELCAGSFRARFEAKGRFAGDLRAVPVWLVVRDDPAFLGLAELARRLG
jgi:glucokinase